MRKNTVRFLRLLTLLLTVVLCFGCISGGLTAQAAENWKSNVPTGDIFGTMGLKEKQIRTVTFLDSVEEAPKKAWNLGKGASSRVKGWIQWDGALADVYLAAKDGINGKDCAKNLFQGCVNLEEVSFGGAFHTEEVTSLEGMFDGCKKLTAVDVETLDTAKVRSTGFMFRNCASLESIDVTTWDTGSLTRTRDMFAGASSLEEVKGTPASGTKDDQGQLRFYPKAIAGNVVQIRMLEELVAVHYNDGNVCFYDVRDLAAGKNREPLETWSGIVRLWSQDDISHEKYYPGSFIEVADSDGPSSEENVTSCEHAERLFGLREDGSVITVGRKRYRNLDYDAFEQMLASWTDVVELHCSNVYSSELLGLCADGTVAFAYAPQTDADDNSYYNKRIAELKSKFGKWKNVKQLVLMSVQENYYGLKEDGTILEAESKDAYSDCDIQLSKWKTVETLYGVAEWSLSRQYTVLGRLDDGTVFEQGGPSTGDRYCTGKSIVRLMVLEECLLGCKENGSVVCMCPCADSKERSEHEAAYRDWGDVVRVETLGTSTPPLGFTKDGRVRVPENNPLAIMKENGNVKLSFFQMNENMVEVDLSRFQNVKTIEMIAGGCLAVLFEDGSLEQIAIREEVDTTAWGAVEQINFIGGSHLVQRKDGSAFLLPRNPTMDPAYDQEIYEPDSWENVISWYYSGVHIVTLHSDGTVRSYENQFLTQ